MSYASGSSASRQACSPRRVALGAAATALAGAVVVFAALRNDGVHAWLKAHASHPFDRRDGIGERSAYYLFDLDRIGETFRYDPVAYLLPRPNHERTWTWPEHPAGRLTRRTNNLGFQEDHATEREKRGVRILVAGDSHTAGLVANHESFANLVESRLGDEPDWQGLEVINAGVAYTGPHCYLGVLRKYLHLEPDVFVAVLFTGNDFWDDLKIRYHLRGWTPPPGDSDYRSTIEEAARRWPGPVSQGFNQAFRWKHFPGESEQALDAAVESFCAMHRLCAKENIRFLAVVLPTKTDVDSDDSTTQEAIRRLLDLTPEDVSVNRELGRRFAEALRAAGTPCLDPTAAMRLCPKALYWRRDYHLGREGHALLADLLAETLVGLR